MVQGVFPVLEHCQHGPLLPQGPGRAPVSSQDITYLPGPRSLFILTSGLTGKLEHQEAPSDGIKYLSVFTFSW